MENTTKIGKIVEPSAMFLTNDEKGKLEAQDSRLVSTYHAQKLELEAKKNWDLFYKRNTTKFFKDRHWTTREFMELVGEENQPSNEANKKLLEIGCGVGNLVFPLIEDKLNKYFIYAMDFSPRAINILRQNVLYNEEYMLAFAGDITTEEVFKTISPGSVDLITLIFVLSAIHPEKFSKVVQNMWKLLKPGGVVLFRDYGLYDMAQIRFKPGSKIAENLYVRQDGTRSYYFSTDETRKLFEQNGFKAISNEYVNRRTINLKEGVDVPRIFVQGKYQKVENEEV